MNDKELSTNEFWDGYCTLAEHILLLLGDKDIKVAEKFSLKHLLKDVIERHKNGEL